MTSGFLPGIGRLQDARDFGTVLGPAVDGYAMVYDHDTGMFVLAAGAGGGVTDHALLTNLSYAASGHTGFAGTGVSNTFTQNQTFNQTITVGNDVTVTDDVTIGDDLSVGGLAVVTETLSVPTIITASNVDLTLNPGGTGNVVLDNATPLRSATFDSTYPIAGAKLGPTATPGQWGLTVGEVNADTIRTVTFVANETRIERANQFWTKSYAILLGAFTTPGSIGGTATITLEDSASITGALASNNDYAVLRTVDVSTGLAIFESWGQLSSYVNNGNGSQSWTFTLRDGDTSTTYLDGSILVIFGASGAAYIHLSVNDIAGAPYIKGRKWVTNPYTPANHTTYWLLGTLGSIGATGTPSYTPVGNGIYVRSGSSANSFIVADDNALQIRGPDFEMYNASTQTVDIASGDGSMKLGTNVANANTTGFTFNGTTGNVTIGGASYAPTVTIYGVVNIKAGSAGIANLTDAGALATVNNLDGVPNGTTYNKTTVNQVTGAGRAFTALNSSNVLVTAVIPGTAVTPSGAGLYLDSTHMGYYSGSAWKTYMDSSGNFLFAGSGAGNYIQWVAASNKLQGVGGSTEQWYASAVDGVLYAGAGNVWLDSSGLNFEVQTFGSPDYIRFERSNSALGTIGFQRATGGGPLTTDGMIFNNIDNTKFRFIGASVMEIGAAGNNIAVNLTGAFSATQSVGCASLNVSRGALTNAATIGGTTHTSLFANSTTEHTYIRGGKAGSHVYINDSSGLGNVIMAEGGGNVGVGAAPAYKFGVVYPAAKATVATNTVAVFGTNDTPGTSDLGLFVRIGGNSTATSRFVSLSSFENGAVARNLILQELGGNVGVGGQPNASWKLDVVGNCRVISTGTTGLQLTANTTGTSIFAGGQALDLHSSNYTGGLGLLHGGNGIGVVQVYKAATEDGDLLLNPTGGVITAGGVTANPAWKFNVMSGTGQVSINPDFSGVNYISSYIGANTAGPLALFGSRVFADMPRFGISTSFTPTSSADTTGSVGDIAWSSGFIYVKVATGASGWKRAALSTF